MIAVVGDVMLDRYWYLGSGYSKTNPECHDGRAYSIQREEWKLGGAASVANILRGLDDEVVLYGTVGDDFEGSLLAHRIDEANISRRLRRSGGRTTVKTRLILDRCLMPDRYDFDGTDGGLGGLDGIEAADAVIVQDYRKGAICRGVVPAIRRLAGDDVPIIVDPGMHVSPAIYDGATVIKANKPEAMAWSDFTQGRHPPQFVADAMQIKVIVTNGDKPVEIYSYGDTEVVGLPVEDIDVVDVCGAGDTIVAALSHRLANGDNLLFACMFAIKAAARQCERIGCNRLKLDEVMV